MSTSTEKSSLRKTLLEKRDSTSGNLTDIVSKKIHERLRRLDIYKNATIVGGYYPIGSEVKTQDIIQDVLSSGKQLCLPKIVDEQLSFKKITSFKDLEKGNFGIMEPKDDCVECEQMDIVLVPTVGISRDGFRLGYGHGYYDRFLSSYQTKKISLTYAKQIVKSIPHDENDVSVDWIITEDESFKV